MLHRISILGSAVAGLLVACASAPAPPPPRSAPAPLCGDLGWAFYTIASYRDRGESRSDQVRWANRELETREARHAALRIIHCTYAAPKPPLVHGLEVIDACRIDERGAAEISFDRRQ